jgi:antitoxin FitA
MATIQVKDVPDDTHRVLKRRAAEAHQSLQEYLRAKLVAEAAQPTLDEVLDRVGYRSGGSAPLSETASDVRDDRDRR